METLQTYDELPYDSLPLPETQPDFLAAVAALHGYPAPPPRSARVLELGCAAGGNLIPLAFHHAESDYVGIELSRLQAEAGASFIAALGLTNARILHADLAALPDDLGTFDYIIAHGVFSWVPPAVQQALLRVCRKHLSPNGLAYVSFNVAAGWQELLPLREALVAGTEAHLPAPQRVAQARALLAELETQWDDPLLLQEIAHLQAAAPSYLFHEFLAEYNAPMRFAGFAHQLQDAGLRYVAEAGPRRAVVAFATDAATSATLATRWMDAEAALDEAMQTRFRRGLISRDDAPPAHPPQSTQLQGLAFYCDLTSDAEIDLDTASEHDFVNPAGGRFSIANPLLKAGVMALSTIYPAAMHYTEWVRAANELMTHFEASGRRDEAEFREALFHLVTVQGIQTCVESTHRATPLDATPQAHALARLQAGTPGWVVSGVRHVALGLDDWGRTLLGLLDGTHSVKMLVQTMQHMLQRAGVELAEDQIEALVQQKLDFFARQGLLQPALPA